MIARRLKIRPADLASWRILLETSTRHRDRLEFVYSAVAEPADRARQGESSSAETLRPYQPQPFHDPPAGDSSRLAARSSSARGLPDWLPDTTWP